MTVCLTMIVRDEAHVIERCLSSVIPLVDAWAIVDTGSTDDTKERILASVGPLPGDLVAREWTNFGECRSASIDLARGKADYALVVDADEVVHGVRQGPLTEEAYALWCDLGGGVRTITHRLFRLDLPWRYEGVIDEYPVCGRPFEELNVLDGMSLSSPQDGRRSLDPDKHRKDIELIGDELVKDPGNSRLVFHLARRWHMLGDYERAARHYLQRAEMGHGLNYEEPYVSLVEAGRCLEMLSFQNKAVDAYLRAHSMWPIRPEATKELARIFAWRASVSAPVGHFNVEHGADT